MSYSELVTVQGVRMSKAAAENVAECAVDVRDDIVELITGEQTKLGLLDFCLENADEDRRRGWMDYVEAVVPVAEKLRDDALQRAVKKAQKL